MTNATVIERDQVLMVNGKMGDYLALVDLMDDDIREEVHCELAPCTNQEFYDRYALKHLKKFDEAFYID